MWRSVRKTVFLLCLIAVVLPAILSGCGGSQTSQLPDTLAEMRKLPEYTTIWTDPQTKIKELSSQEFTKTLFLEEQAFMPSVAKKGTTVYLGFWSGPGNHGSLLKTIDAVNALESPDKTAAFWDEGIANSYQFPSYITMSREHWYDRAYPEKDQVTIFGVNYTDPHPVTPEDADEIWGDYSQRFAQTAELIYEATGVPVKALCFVQGAKANRIFYTNEFPMLKKLEATGAVKILFAKTPDADYSNSSDWIEGSENAPLATPAE